MVLCKSYTARSYDIMDTEYQSFIKTLRAGQKPEFPAHAKSIEYARELDEQDKLSHLRDGFNIPKKSSLRKKALDGTVPGMQPSNTSTLRFGV